jgi:uncharacterized protein with NAD-binding domain and iron-sulfur cluster
LPEPVVAILGGGVAGLTAAHELAELGFHVEVYEKRSIAQAGGKARSVHVPESATDGRSPLPGEHGFRFFPGFYRHVPNTMERIRASDGAAPVFDHLVETTEGLFASATQTIVLPGGRPKTIGQVHDVVLAVRQLAQLGIGVDELDYFAERLVVYLTSCDDRRYDEWEHMSWWTFVDADNHTQVYQDYLADGMTRALVAARAKEISARTCANVIVQLLLCTGTPQADRLLNGPTNDVWINPWIAYLISRGVRFHDQTEVTQILSSGTEVTGLTITSVGDPPGHSSTVTAEYYIAAVPVEIMARLVTPAMLEVAPTLAGLARLAQNTRWMNGIQFYLDRPTPIVHGHVVYPDTRFRLTSVSQAQFWPDFDFKTVGDGSVNDVLSVDISDWTTPGVIFDKPAMELSPDQIRQEVWAQLTTALNRDGVTRLADGSLRSWYLDSDIVPPSAGTQAANLEPLLVNTAGSWDNRPKATIGLNNLFLAGDYVRTNTDLATMEAANESARSAVNGMLDRLEANGGRPGIARCQVWPLTEPDIFQPLRRADQVLYDHRRPHHAVSHPDGWATFFTRVI